MATLNPFALLGDDDNGDPADFIARAGAVATVTEIKRQPPPQSVPAKLPTKPPPPAQAVRDSRGTAGRGRGGGRGGGRGSFGNRERGYEGGNNRAAREGGFQGDRGDSNDRTYSRNGGEYRGGRGGNSSIENGDFTAPREEGEGRYVQDAGRGRGRGRGRGYFADGEDQFGRRIFDRRSGSGRGSEVKRDGVGRGNWGAELDNTAVEEVLQGNVVDEKPIMDPVERKVEEGTEADSGEKKEAEEEDKEMTLEEYEKLLAEKRKGLQSLKAEERKVTLDKDLALMQVVDKKKDEEILKGMDKGKKKELSDKEERARKSLSINEFLRPAEGDAMYGRRSRGGRLRGGFRGGPGGAYYSQEALSAPRIEDPGQFPTLGGK